MGQAAPILIKNASLVISMEPTAKDVTGRLHDQDILIDDGKIVAIGEHLDTKGMNDLDIIDATGKIVMPGLVDVHDHLWQSTIRGCGIDKTVTDWLPACVFPINFNYQQTYDAVTLSTLDLINSGVTTVVDWSHAYNPEFVKGNVQALKDSGLRYVYTYYLTPEHNKNAVETKAIVDKDELGTFNLAAHPTMAMKKNMQNAVDLAAKMDTTLNLHYAENLADRADGQTEVIKETNATSVKLLLDHVVNVNDDEIDMMAKSHARVSYNALSNMRLASGIAPVGKIHKAGIEIGLGLDGGTSDNANFFTLMKSSVGLQRAAHHNATAFPTVPDVLYLATMGGAKVLEMDDQIGSLKVGKNADIIILNPATTNMGVNHSELAQIVFNAEPANVEYVIVNGKTLKSKGQLPISKDKFKALLASNNKTVDQIKVKEQ